MAGVVALVLGCEKPTTANRGAPFRIEVAHDFSSLAAGDFVTTFDFAGDGTLWVASFQGAIIRVRNGQVSRFEASSILGAAEVRDLFVDAAGRPWVTGGGSLAVFENGVWSPQGPADLMGLSPKAGQVAVNEAGDVLVGVGDVDAGGLLLRRGNRWQAITPSNSALPSPLVQQINVGADGSFWIGSAMFQGKGGLIHLVDGNIVAVHDKARSGLLYDWIDDVAVTADRVWLGFAARLYDLPDVAEGGIQELRLTGGAPTTRYPAETGLISNRVESLVRTRAGEVWFTASLDAAPGKCGTCVAGIGFVDASGAFHILSSLNSDLAPNEYMPQIREAPGGVIYVARADARQIAKVVR